MTKKSENTISIEEFNKYFEIDTNINNLRNRKDLLILKKEIDGHVQVHNCYFVYEDKKVYKYDLLKKEIVPFNALDVVNDLVNGRYNSDRNKFNKIYSNLLTYNDEFFVLKDFEAYVNAQDKIDKLYRDMERWQKICGINIAHSGIFSSDRTIKEYATGIWDSKVLYKNL